MNETLLNYLYEVLSESEIKQFNLHIEALEKMSWLTLQDLIPEAETIMLDDSFSEAERIYSAGLFLFGLKRWEELGLDPSFYALRAPNYGGLPREKPKLSHLKAYVTE